MIAEEKGCLHKKFPVGYFQHIDGVSTPNNMTVLEWLHLQWGLLFEVYAKAPIQLTVANGGTEKPVDSTKSLKEFFDVHGLSDQHARWVYIQFLEQTETIKVYEGGVFSNAFKKGMNRANLIDTFTSTDGEKTYKLCALFVWSKVAASLWKIRTANVDERDESPGEIDNRTERSIFDPEHLLPPEHPLSPVILGNTPLAKLRKQSPACSPQRLDHANSSTIFDILEASISPIKSNDESPTHWAEKDESGNLGSGKEPSASPIKPQRLFTQGSDDSVDANSNRVDTSKTTPEENSVDEIAAGSEPAGELQSKQTSEKKAKQDNEREVSSLAIGAVAGAVVASLGLVAHATRLSDGVFYALTGRLTQRAKQTLAHDVSTATTQCKTQAELRDAHIAMHKRFLHYHTDDVEEIYTMAEALTTAAAAA